MIEVISSYIYKINHNKKLTFYFNEKKYKIILLLKVSKIYIIKMILEEKKNYCIKIIKQVYTFIFFHNKVVSIKFFEILMMIKRR